jgi:hypothetical protein
MTVAELIEQLSRFDPSTLICVDTLWKPGLYPAAESVEPYCAEMNANTYQTVILRPTDWP